MVWLPNLGSARLLLNPEGAGAALTAAPALTLVTGLRHHIYGPTQDCKDNVM